MSGMVVHEGLFLTVVSRWSGSQAVSLHGVILEVLSSYLLKQSKIVDGCDCLLSPEPECTWSTKYKVLSCSQLQDFTNTVDVQ